MSMKTKTPVSGGSYGTKIADLYIVHNLAAANGSSRHTYHVMPPVGWMNDPNGFGEAFGKYHLFYSSIPTAPRGTPCTGDTTLPRISSSGS